MEGSIVLWLLCSLCFALVATSAVSAFRMPKLSLLPEPNTLHAARDFYQNPFEFPINANVSCMTTGPSCIRSCTGQADGNYQSCSSCTKYVRCASNVMNEMSCPSRSAWDSLAKACRRNSGTCIPCPAKSVSWFTDKHNPQSLRGQRYFKAGVAPLFLPHPDFRCERSSTMMLKAPRRAKAVQFYLSFYQGPYQYAFHISNSRSSDGWSKWDGSPIRRSDAEMHCYNGDLYAFTSSKRGGRAVINKKKVIKTHLYIKITRSSIYVNNFNGYEETIRKRIFKLNKLYFGINRIINKFKGDVTPSDRIGSALDAVWISWIQ